MPAERADILQNSSPSPYDPLASVRGGSGDADGDSAFRRDFNAAVYDCVRRVPEGKVVSYGQVAKLIGHPRHSRMVGSALKVLPSRLSIPYLPPTPSSISSASSSDEPLPPPEPNPDFVPWHRVVASSGLISPRGNVAATRRQAEWLEAEGVEVREGPRVGGGGGGGGQSGGGTADAFGLGGAAGGGRVIMGRYAWKG
ncbi:Alkyltransferase-like protein 1 [Rhodotorula toruloides]